MSAQARDGPAVPAEKKGGLSRIMSRMKTVLKRSDGSKRLSFSARSAPITATAATTTTTTTTAGPSVTKSAQPTPVAAPEPVETTTATDGSQPTKIMRSQVDADRAKKLAERFAMTLDLVYTGPDKEISRVEKPIRMRIHRSCHRCNATFKGSKICSQCEHARCKACPRYPPKKTDKKETEKKETEPVVATVVRIEPDTYWGLREQMLLTKPSARPGGQPLVRKQTRQRVRRTCHECNALFTAGNRICSVCEHVRCVECPRDPAKKKSYPDGYPGDAFSSNTSRPVKYSCHKCLKVFPPIPHPDSKEGIARKESGAEPLSCVRCQHPMCSQCPRAPPVRVELAPDPEVLRSVQAKLAALGVSNSVAS